ncbi:unnamed protein product [Heterobilharzia americana]|nr:unnamed protein product [Heterobilharzia americana]
MNSLSACREWKYSSQASLLLSPRKLRISGDISPAGDLRYRKFINREVIPDDVEYYSDDSSIIDVADRVRHSSSSGDEDIATTRLYTEMCLPNNNNNNSSNYGSPSVIRFMENVYIREEEDDEGDFDDAYSEFQLTNSSTHNSHWLKITKTGKKHQIFLIITIMTVILLCTVCKYYDFSSLIPYSSSSSGESFLSVQKDKSYKLIRQLSEEFHDQHKRLWLQIRSALDSPFQYESTNQGYTSSLTSHERIPPVVLLLVNRCIQPVGSQSRQHSNNKDKNSVLFQSFISRLGQLVSREYFSNDTHSCPVLGSYQLASLNKQKIDEMKLDLDNQLIKLYQSGTRCFHFMSIDLLPADIVLLFHGYTDVENSIYPNSVLLISLSKTFIVSSPENCTKNLTIYCLVVKCLVSSSIKSISFYDHYGIKNWVMRRWTP